LRAADRLAFIPAAALEALDLGDADASAAIEQDCHAIFYIAAASQRTLR
jgi:hypothetical protein